MSSLRKLFCLVCFCLLIPGSGFAENCEVGVKVIKGSKHKSKTTNFGSLSKSLVTMKGQLGNLPYKEYGVMTTRSQSVKFGAEGNFSVRDAMGKPHVVKIKPLTVKDKRVEVLVDWHGSDSSKLLSTKLKVLNGENVMLGTDSSGEHSTILSIQVSCPT